MIKFQCECGRKIAAPDQWLGRRVKCPQCGKPVLVQETAAVAPAAPAVPAPQPAVEEKHEPTATPDIGPVAGSASDAEHHAAGSQFNVGSGDDKTHAPRSSSQTPEGRAGDEAADSDAIEDNGDTTSQHPAPTVNAPPRQVFVAPQAPPVQHEHREGSHGRGPLLFGVLALIAAIAGAVLYWVPTVESYVSPVVAGLGLFLAIISLILSLRRERTGLAFPVLATVVSLLALSLPWTLPVIQGASSHSESAPAKVWTADKTDAANESMRRMVIAVDSLQLTGDKGGPTAAVEYKLTNKGSRAIKSAAGSIQLYDKDHKSLGALALDPDFGKTPLAPGASANRKSTWPMDSAMQQALSANLATAEYRAETVTFGDGTVEKFDK